MSLPGFTADRSLYRTTRAYRMVVRAGSLTRGLDISPSQGQPGDGNGLPLPRLGFGCGAGRPPCGVAGRGPTLHQVCCEPGTHCCDPNTHFCCPDGTSCCGTGNSPRRPALLPRPTDVHDCRWLLLAGQCVRQASALLPCGLGGGQGQMLLA